MIPQRATESWAPLNVCMLTSFFYLWNNKKLRFLWENIVRNAPFLSSIVVEQFWASNVEDAPTVEPAKTVIKEKKCILGKNVGAFLPRDNRYLIVCSYFLLYLPNKFPKHWKISILECKIKVTFATLATMLAALSQLYFSVFQYWHTVQTVLEGSLTWDEEWSCTLLQLIIAF